ncbi:MAG: 50S ribosomal protein L33 [Elusimicrobiota bacterium]|jgi:large subunit ribosomal protein L33
MGDRVVTILACGTCKNKNYSFQHGKKRQYKVEVKKFCRKCRKQTPHKEVK